MLSFLRSGILTAVIVGLTLAPVWAQKGNPEAGKPIYEKKCWWCHGETGEGNGPAAKYLSPPPRNFANGIYKYKTSTYEEIFPFDEDLYRAISEGMPGTSMPGWKDVLKDREIRDLVAYIKGIAGVEAPAKRVDPGKKGSAPKEAMEKGKQLFKDRCAECHGEAGRGDASKKLKEDAGARVWPRDLTKGRTFRMGNDPKEIFTRIMTGIPGTPMPSFVDPKSEKKLTEEEAWQVAHFAASLNDEQRKGIGEDDVVFAARVSGDLPDKPDDPRWNEARMATFPLVPQFITKKDRLFTPTVDAITVRALYNDKEIAFLLEWGDRTKSLPGDPKAQELADGELYEDAVSLQFAVNMPESFLDLPYFGMGGKGNPVNLWHWKSGPAGGKETVGVLDAIGYEKITPRNPGGGVTGRGAYEQGLWRVVLRRALTTEQEKDPQFKDGVFVPVALAVWDGNNGEKGGKHTLTTWYWVLLRPKTGMEVYVLPLLVAGLVVGAEVWFLRRLRKKAGG